jgi:hypothetical protein
MRTPSALSLTAPPGTTGKATQPPILKRSPWPQAIPPRRAAWEGPQYLNPRPRKRYSVALPEPSTRAQALISRELTDLRPARTLEGRAHTPQPRSTLKGKHPDTDPPTPSPAASQGPQAPPPLTRWRTLAGGWDTSLSIFSQHQSISAAASCTARLGHPPRLG